MLSFENTKIAFETKSDKDLKREYWMFKLVRKKWLVKIGKVVLPLLLKMKIPIKGLIKSTVFKQFCGGETIHECDQRIEVLYKENVGTILDYSIEGQTKEKDFESTAKEIKRTIDKASGNKAIPFAVFKLTGLGRHALLEIFNDKNTQPSEAEQKEFEKVKDRVSDICEYAYKKEVPLFIDAEETWIQNTIDRLAESQMKIHNIEKAFIYNTTQMYRVDRMDYIKQQISKAKEEGYVFGAKLVRGAYMEKERLRAHKMGYPSPIQPDKTSTDMSYNNAIRYLVEQLDHCSFCCGTHNENSAHLLAHLIDKHGIDKTDRRIFFAQLLGMSDHISFNLAHYDYEVVKYVPYGPIKEVMPYLLRRADENSSVTGQTGRELKLIAQEWERRKDARKNKRKGRETLQPKTSL